MKVLVAGDLNADLIFSGFPCLPQPGREVLASDFSLELGSSSAICAAGLARLGTPVALCGKLGNDILYGGRDKDAFVFDTKASKTANVDKIVDFNVADDSIWLDNAQFKALGSKGTLTKPAQLSAKMFWSGTKAHDKDDRVIYDKKSGALYYDADGAGSAAQVKIATLSKNLKVTYKDFFVI